MPERSFNLGSRQFVWIFRRLGVGPDGHEDFLADATSVEAVCSLGEPLGIGRKRAFMETFPYGIKNERIRDWIVGRMLSGDSAGGGLPGNPWPSLAEFVRLSGHVRRRLDRVRAPCLVIHSTNDDIASLDNVAIVERSVSAPVETILLDDSYHMISVDQQRDVVIERSAGFFRRLAA